jgi:hypothetical protein
VTCYRRRVDKVVCQEFNPTRLLMAAPDIGAERIGSASWISGERTTTSRVDSGSTSLHSSPAIAGASPLATSTSSGGCPGDSLGLRRQAFNRHRLGDGGSFGFGPCQQKTTGLVTLSGYDYSLRIIVFVQCTHLLQYLPLAM